ncbi:PREDICTED: prefoldin subunit 4 [Nicrophorus vespilloides]|uniref:Prefoldin subunit 4 n=1 Tax=Nicrophorus vespilloides TaxID=110193 RepID=A0ABM1MJQ8_NICVS|nr:PREDICTED: prefoldin subunit 4 [Nicrophorus vespilloides]
MSSNKGTFQPDSDVHITFEDQQRINKFARLNARREDLKEEIKVKEGDLTNIEEACDEVALYDDEEKVPYLVGEVFIYQDCEKTQECLKEAKSKVEQEINVLKMEGNKLKEMMTDLKSMLYGKFGSHINLEADD